MIDDEFFCTSKSLSDGKRIDDRQMLTRSDENSRGGNIPKLDDRFMRRWIKILVRDHRCREASR